MNDKFKISERIYGDSEKEYRVENTDPNSSITSVGINTKDRVVNGPGIVFYAKGGTPITGRNYNAYPKGLQNLVNGKRLERDTKVLEIGAGIGGFIPQMVLRGLKPTVIDPANYREMLEMLQFARENINGDFEALRYIKGYIERCEMILDPNQVRLVNTTLEDALDKGLVKPGEFDLAIDYMAVGLYSGDEYSKDWERVESIVRSLITPDGVSIVSTQEKERLDDLNSELI